MLLALTMLAVISDFAAQILAGSPGRAAHYWLYAVLSVFLIAQNYTFYLACIFIDYFIHQNEKRALKILSIFRFFMLLYAVSVAGNLFYHYYFSISGNNVYTPGSLYLLRLLISYFPFILALLDIFFSAAHFKQSQIASMIFFAVLTTFGAALDVMLGGANLIWPCFASALLYLYFFIVRSDSKLDSLTDLGNRFSFNEFMDKLSRPGAKELYSIVLIDMDHFKEINDTAGHLEGDNALRDMAAIIKGHIRESDFAARYGGDEFIIAVKSGSDIEGLMKRIQAAIDLQNGKAQRPYKLQMSYGWDTYAGSSSRDAVDFLAHIDRLMYANKTAKRAARC
jgi:diguanylate cyclase (GGDEF)-like protein